jgi:hypothetical protein
MCRFWHGRGALAALALFAALFCAARCSSSSADDDWWNSECVREQLGMQRHLADGAKCYAMGYADCGRALGSECIGYCVFDICQPGQCKEDSDCAIFGSDYECTLRVLEDLNDDATGLWCRASDCPRGSMGCACRADGTCAADPFGSGAMDCTKNVCASACPAACRSGSICCGGAFCSGDCIGAPCCS